MLHISTLQTNDILKLAHDQDVRSVDLLFTDVVGIVKTVTIDAERLTAALTDGVWFDGSAVEGSARVAEADMYLKPDPATFAVLSWETAPPLGGRTAQLFCDVYTPNGEPFAGDPRGVLRRALQSAAAIGTQFAVSTELEFYLFLEPVGSELIRFSDQAGYFDASDPVARLILQRVRDALRSMGIAVEAVHHEAGKGQHEIDLAPVDALRAADAIVTARMVVRAIARQEGRFATFMAKPISHAPGSGMHMHQWLHDLNSGNNRFSDPTNDYGLSREAQAFLAGQLMYAREICAVLAPTVNSYKRLMAGLEAPVYATWAQLNQGALLRVPRLAGQEQPNIRLEMRCPDPGSNPYLALAVMLQAGLRGIQ
ncbi:MAG: glutamine synthetase, partial [Chloroflexi bacterium]|nr:glutamine synthetase [Chloroflexota bacterium]